MEAMMTATEVRLYVDRNSRQWVVLDPEGNFWRLPSTEEPWNDRQPFELAEETELDPVPGHYKTALGVPNRMKPR
jgi:hypothetical protein